MNYNNVLKAIEMITSPEGLGMSPKRIMVSTSGVLKWLKIGRWRRQIQIGSFFALRNWWNPNHAL
jgi:adenine C2-methylase RlmN of 23S rRNA A2503 and tRNA A37